MDVTFRHTRDSSLVNFVTEGLAGSVPAARAYYQLLFHQAAQSSGYALPAASEDPRQVPLAAEHPLPVFGEGVDKCKQKQLIALQAQAAAKHILLDDDSLLSHPSLLIRRQSLLALCLLVLIRKLAGAFGVEDNALAYLRDDGGVEDAKFLNCLDGALAAAEMGRQLLYADYLGLSRG